MEREGEIHATDDCAMALDPTFVLDPGFGA